MILSQLKRLVERTISEVEKDYQKTQGLILTEGDLQCILYQRLGKYSIFSKSKPTSDKMVLSPSLHTELSWYDDQRRLTIKPDITILDQKYLSILHGTGDKAKLPSKSCSFGGDAILLELKFIRSKGGIRAKTVEKELRKDLNKIDRLLQRLDDQHAPYKIFCYFVVFNKTDIKCREFELLEQSINHPENPRYKLIYGTGKVKFN